MSLIDRFFKKKTPDPQKVTINGEEWNEIKATGRELEKFLKDFDGTIGRCILVEKMFWEKKGVPFGKGLLNLKDVDYERCLVPKTDEYIFRWKKSEI